MGQPLLIAGDLNADPGIIPCLAIGLRLVGFLFWHWLIPLVVEMPPAGQVGSAGTRRDFMIACPNALAVSVGCQVTDRWFVPHFSLLVEIRQWVAEAACPPASQPIWPHRWVDAPDWSSSPSKVVQGDVRHLQGGSCGRFSGSDRSAWSCVR